MDPTLAILVLVAVMYVLILIGVVIFIVKKRNGSFKQTIDAKPDARLKNELEEK